MGGQDFVRSSGRRPVADASLEQWLDMDGCTRSPIGEQPFVKEMRLPALGRIPMGEACPDRCSRTRTTEPCGEEHLLELAENLALPFVRIGSGEQLREHRVEPLREQERRKEVFVSGGGGRRSAVLCGADGSKDANRTPGSGRRSDALADILKLASLKLVSDTVEEEKVLSGVVTALTLFPCSLLLGCSGAYKTKTPFSRRHMA
mmetsp:Transcript_9971/g.21292  ORF Transcript_9971/g.21292 Transcript_9971/m.21292 type:complete len:204 (+) Transcript_9971:1417-2028(+)